MTRMTKKERVRATLAAKPVDRLAVSLWGHDFLREATAEALVEQTVESYRRYDWDFVKLNPRWTFYAEAWGNVYEPPSEQRHPRLTHRVVQASEDLDAIVAVDPEVGVLGEHLEALARVVEQIGRETDILYTVFSPLAVCSLLTGKLGEPITEWARDEPARVHTAIAAIAETLTGHARAALDRGAAGIFFAPLQWTSRTVCSDELYRELGRPYDLRVVDAVRDAPFNVLHVCGDHNRIDQLLDYPVPVLNWDDHGDGNPSLARLQARTSKAVMGGVSHLLLGELDPRQIGSHVRDALRGCSRTPFLSGGCAIPPTVSPQAREAVRRMAIRPGSSLGL